ncbi:MAG TPA: tRNA (adenosine(37)-N6)-threonylcarbamoyltransferase complex ATPase subunit type 1 TsaE [Syntrophales bacterium]|nr:tRNA (adenosine(37)-N6)-threonylcarbamoyltransferase complex ATPase subunit type 1 TsaE [Syntrophales bacterium]HOL59741.1 tRNA (adenosine(37)-N6)-threonylcarbamoyltransferase complex ATPase subunit type 1 TsaE [Syntrophales bacterium]HPO35887.1 tRNA (adenosine(37)-N6)-threonylcarbamoyltransferase complex ATPase subunit type 1 TsaE [Syntrophales bacterium]
MKGTVYSQGEEETFDLGRLFASCLKKGDVVALRGELGTGKTCFTKGMARGLGVPEEYVVTSPSFTIVNEYPGRIPLYHVDVYRFSGAEELSSIGFEEYVYGEGVTVIEWADKILDFLPPPVLVVDFFYVDDKRREIVFSGPDDPLEKIRQLIENGGYTWH